MAIRALRLDETWDYVSKLDDCRVVYKEEGPRKGQTDVQASEENGATVWVLGVLTSRISGLLSDKATRLRGSMDPSAGPDEACLEIDPNSKAYRAVQHGLKGFRNFVDPLTGGDVAHDTTVAAVAGSSWNLVSAHIMDRIPAAVLRELCEEIESRNTVGEEEAAKSPVDGAGGGAVPGA